ncbi:MAG TPA: hypothetical protein VK540_06725 [Polyangiaceae bacterium]|nr:hypothetical protein [Polyangiaceae bacterium]
MITRQSLMAAPLALLMCAGIGCGASREIDVKGQLASTVRVEGPITVQFFDVVETAKPALVHSITIQGLAAFDAKAPLEGKEVLVRAINDRDGNGACSTGEPWGEARALVKDDDTVDAVSVQLTAGACPAE